MKLKSIISSCFILIVLAGCSGKVFTPYQNEFSCENKVKGGTCGSMSEVYEKTLKIEDETDLKLKKVNRKIHQNDKEIFKSTILAKITKDETMFNFDEQIPIYEKPKVAKMVVVGYLDEDGDWHKKEEIFMKIKKAKFVLPNNQFTIHEEK